MVARARQRKRASWAPLVVGAFCPMRPNVLWAMDFQFRPDRHITLVFAVPGCPWQNGWVE